MDVGAGVAAVSAPSAGSSRRDQHPQPHATSRGGLGHRSARCSDPGGWWQRGLRGPERAGGGPGRWQHCLGQDVVGCTSREDVDRRAARAVDRAGRHVAHRARDLVDTARIARLGHGRGAQPNRRVASASGQGRAWPRSPSTGTPRPSRTGATRIDWRQACSTQVVEAPGAGARSSGFPPLGASVGARTHVRGRRHVPGHRHAHARAREPACTHERQPAWRVVATSGTACTSSSEGIVSPRRGRFAGAGVLT